MRQLEIMARHRLVDGDLLQHGVVVLAEEGVHALRRPVLRRGRDVIESLLVLLQGSRRAAGCDRDSPLELRCGDDVQRFLEHRDEAFLLHERGGLGQRLGRLRNDGVVVRVLLRRLVEDGLDRGAVIRRRRLLRKQLRPHLHRGEVHRRPRRLEVGFRAVEDLLFRKVGIESEPQLLAELLVAEAKISVRARQQLRLQPLLVVRQRRQRRRLRRPELLLQPRRLLHQRLQLLLHQLRRPFVLLDGSLGMHLRRRLEIRLCRGDYRRNSIQAPDDRSQPLLRGRELS